ncbi:MAG TPA: cell division protein FtsQ/DivIB [Candidatus Dormibacteraeota bacterium]
MKRRLVAAVLIAFVALAVYWLLIRDPTVAAHLEVPRATATIGSGSEAIAVGADGQILAWLPLSEEQPLPSLSLSAPPKGGNLAGPVLQQARVLGAAPAALRPYLESSYYGETGVDVKLRSGIELRFGDASQSAAKWKAAAAVLADPSITALDYVDLHAPGRPAVGGSGHTLPPVE